MQKKIWMATAEPAGRYWHIKVDGLRGATQARSSKEIDEMVRDFIETKAAVPAGEIEVSVRIQLPAEVERILHHAELLRQESDAARKQAAAESGRAAKALRNEGLTIRDIGVALGVSFQRAQQLVNR